MGDAVSWWQRLIRRKAATLPEPNWGHRSQYATVEWLVPWKPINDVVRAAHLKNELAREVCETHLLKGRDAEFIAARQDRDDFLIALEQGEVASVHLTWSRETDPAFPGTTLYPSFDEWRRTEMVPDAQEWDEIEKDYLKSGA